MVESSVSARSLPLPVLRLSVITSMIQPWQIRTLPVEKVGWFSRGGTYPEGINAGNRQPDPLLGEKPLEGRAQSVF
jgi:hypothetical protein